MPPVLWALSLLILLSPQPGWGEEEAPPFSDPTIPFSTTRFDSHLEEDLFSDFSFHTRSRWRVGLRKIYPGREDRSWILIEGRRVGVGSSLLGGQVISLTQERLLLQQGEVQRSLLLLECDSDLPAYVNVRNGGDIEPCQGRFFQLELPGT